MILVAEDTFEAFLERVCEKLGVPAKKLYTSTGGVVDDVELLRDDDVLYVSLGEPFLRDAAHSPDPIAAHIPVSISSDEIGE